VPGDLLAAEMAAAVSDLDAPARSIEAAADYEPLAALLAVDVDPARLAAPTAAAAVATKPPASGAAGVAAAAADQPGRQGGVDAAGSP
jgi:hypothetical protein